MDFEFHNPTSYESNTFLYASFDQNRSPYLKDVVLKMQC